VLLKVSFHVVGPDWLSRTSITAVGGQCGTNDDHTRERTHVVVTQLSCHNVPDA
jgi:hypothetical protein